MNQVTEPAAIREWREQLAAVAADHGPGWESGYRPGSFGCHELLDRVNLLGDLLEGQVLDHPSCALRAEWHRLAAQAVDSLRELYQRVGAEHLAEHPPAEPGVAADPAGLAAFPDSQFTQPAAR